MATTLGISTQDTWNGPTSWPGQYHEITDVRYTHQYGGGPGSLTCRLVIPTGDKPKGLTAGKIIRLWRGVENIWTGIVSQPDTGGDGIGITAEGIGQAYAARWVCTVGTNALVVDDQVNAAITRGLPWRYPAKAPTPVTGTLLPGSTLKDSLDEVTKQTGYEWSVDATGLLTWSAPATTCTYLLWAWGQGGARTLDNFGTDFYAAYNPVPTYLIDGFVKPLALTGGTIWVTDTTVHHEGTECTMTLGPSTGHRNFVVDNGAAISLDGYDQIKFTTAVAGTGAPVSRTFALTLESGAVRWTLPNILAEYNADGAWHWSSVNLDAPPVGFDLNNVTGYFFLTNAGIYLDDMNAVSPFHVNVKGTMDVQLTPDQSNDAARARYGRYEVGVDLTQQGGLSTNAASKVAQMARDKYSYRIRWTQPFAATKHSLTTMTGMPVDLCTVSAGCRIRVLLADLNEAEIGTTGDAVEFVVGETDYEESTDTLTLTPMDTTRKDLIALLGQLPKGKSS